MRKIIFLVPSLVLFLSSAKSEVIYPKVSFGGKNLGEMLVKVKDGKYTEDNTLSFGNCKSNTLNDFEEI